MSDSSSRTSVWMRIAVIGSALLVLLALAAFWYTSQLASKSSSKKDSNAIVVTIENNACEPNEITVPAGRTTFTVVNKSQRALEWEILDGVMVVEERENIAPGFSQNLSVRLEPGKFEMTCGLLTNPRGTLTVTPSSASDAEAAKPSLVRYIGALAEYKVYTAIELKALQREATELVQAIQSGDIARAREAYPVAHQHYKRVEPAAALFADLDMKLEAHAQYFEKRENDPQFSGFHRIEYGLQQGADVEALKPVAEQLNTDIGTLNTRLQGQGLQPQQLIGSAAKVLRRNVDDLKLQGDKSDSVFSLSDLQGTLDGTQKVSELLRPLLTKAAPDLQKKLDEHFSEVTQVMDANRKDEQIQVAALTQAQYDALISPLHALIDDFDHLNAALGLE